MTMLSHEEVMASIQAPSTFIPSKICSPSQDEESMDVVTLSCDEIMSEPATEIVATAGTGSETVFKTSFGVWTYVVTQPLRNLRVTTCRTFGKLSDRQNLFCVHTEFFYTQIVKQLVYLLYIVTWWSVATPRL